MWFSSSKRSRKARNLAADPRCVLTTEDSMNPLVLEGAAELLTSQADLDRYLSIMNAKYATNSGPDMVDPSANCTFRIRPVGLRADAFTGSPTRWVFER